MPVRVLGYLLLLFGKFAVTFWEAIVTFWELLLLLFGSFYC